MQKDQGGETIDLTVVGVCGMKKKFGFGSYADAPSSQFQRAGRGADSFNFRAAVIVVLLFNGRQIIADSPAAVEIFGARHFGKNQRQADRQFCPQDEPRQDGIQKMRN